MLGMILRKMLKSRWLVLSLFAGLITATSLLSSIPTYTDGILQRLLIKDLEQYQLLRNKHPGTYLFSRTFRYYGPPDREAYEQYNRTIVERHLARLALPWEEHTQAKKIVGFAIYPEIVPDTPSSETPAEPRMHSVKIEGIERLPEHIQFRHGRLFSPDLVDGAYEAIVSEYAMKSLDLRLNRTYMLGGPEDAPALRIRVVGIFTASSAQDPFWYTDLSHTYKSLYVHYGLMNQALQSSMGIPAVEVEWYYALDYHAIQIKRLGALLNGLRSQVLWASSEMIAYDIPMLPILESYLQKERELKITFLFLQIPVMLMIGFFLYMVSQLITEREENEIAVLKSRGAGKAQIFLIYLVGNLAVGLLALLAGPLLGLLLCRIIGSTNGFLEFVQRTALPLSLSTKAFLFPMTGIGLFMVAILAPAFHSSKSTIVLYKQGIAKRTRGGIWKRFYLDGALLALSAYGIYRYQAQQRILEITGARGSDLPIDPLLFGISVLFILGAGLLFVRGFPYVIRLAFWLGKRVWSPEIYAAFISVGRTFGNEQYVVIFLVLTVSIGVYSSSTARTVNKHIEDNIRYSTGSGINLTPFWFGPHAFSDKVDPAQMTGFDVADEKRIEEGTARIPKREPPYESYAALSGIASATKVFRRTDVTIQAGGGHRFKATLLAIIPHEFGEIAWFRSDLLPYPWHDYLNLMTRSPKAMLISRTVHNKHSIFKGDSFQLSWDDHKPLEGLAYEIVDYWPTFNPYEQDDEDEGSGFLIVANLTYVQAMTGIEPYEIWLKKEAGVSSKDIYRDIYHRGLTVVSLKDAALDIVAHKNSPAIQGTNGMLTLGFLVTLAIALIGFLICWYLSIQKRTLQFGVMRAMGLPKRAIVVIIATEQLLITVPSVLVGIAIGGIAGQLFIPFLQLVESKTRQIPPFVVGALWRDYTNLLLFVLAMITLVFALMILLVSRIRIHQALKLGEE